MHLRGQIEEESLVAPFMGDDGGDEERFDSVVDTGRWRMLKVILYGLIYYHLFCFVLFCCDDFILFYFILYYFGDFIYFITFDFILFH